MIDREAVYKALPGIMEIASRDCPSIGLTVEVLQGKHRGKTGVVFWHGRNPYIRFPHQFHTDLQAAVSDASGIHGFRIGIKTEEEKFFVDADKVKIIAAK